MTRASFGCIARLSRTGIHRDWVSAGSPLAIPAPVHLHSAPPALTSSSPRRTNTIACSWTWCSCRRSPWGSSSAITRLASSSERRACGWCAATRRRKAHANDDELETALYRITQEALTNATKHGQATRIVAEIHEDPTTVHLTVRDNGDGFDPDAESDGFGLLAIRERTELLNGELQVMMHDRTVV